jgi:hypothetical protein
VTSQVIHEDDPTGLEGRNQDLLHVSGETFAIDRSVEDAWCGEPVIAQRAHKGHGSPMTVRCKTIEPLAFRTPAAQRRHIGSDPGFINENELARVETALPSLPARSLTGDVRPVLVNGEQRFL